MTMNPTSEQQPNKNKRKRSIVWEHFTIEDVGDGCMRACCKQCKKSFAYITGSKLAGTSHLKRHITLGICPVNRQRNEASSFTPDTKTNPPRKRCRATPVFSTVPFDQGRYNHDLARMIIQHQYPLHMVKQPAFIDFVRTLQPKYSMASFNTIQDECVSMYLREKQNLLNLISGIPGRVNLALDLVTSNQNIGYALLTGYFIDGDWNINRRLLNVVMLPFPDTDHALTEAVEYCLADWHLDNKLFTLTLDQSFANETVCENLRGLLSVRHRFMLNGQLLKRSCYACVLSCLAQDALGAMKEIIQRIRDNVKYVKTSEANDERFSELRQQLQTPSRKELVIDDQTRWDTTYNMLTAACELKEVFACLDTCDPIYKINPLIDDWKQVEILCSYLKLLYDAANVLTASTPAPASTFYNEVSKIQLALTHATMSEDSFIRDLTKPLKNKFDQYWKECFLVLAVAVVLDPRFKMTFIEFSFSKIFGEDGVTWIKIIDDALHELFLEYLAPNLYLSDGEGGDLGMVQSEIPPDVVHSQDGVIGALSLEAHLEEVPLQMMNYSEAPPHRAQSQERHPDEMHLEKVASQEAPLQQINAQVPSQGIPTQEMQGHEMPSEYLSNGEMESHEMPSQDQSNGEMESHEMPSQDQSNGEMQSHEMPSQDLSNGEMHSKEAPAQEVPYQEMDSQEQPQEVGIEAQPQVIYTPELVPVEVHCEEISIHGKETEELQYEEIGPQEMHTEKLQAQVLHQEMQSQYAQDQPLISITDSLAAFDYLSEFTNGEHMKSELEQYLQEPLLPRVQEDFDVLGWWRINELNYPVLSKMAADILSIPLATVAPDAVFNTGNKKIDSHMSSLDPLTLEALICTRDWMQHGLSSPPSSSPLETPNAFVKKEL